MVIIGSYVATQVVKNDLYGNSCIEAADSIKKSKFLDQLQTLESNQLSDEDLQGGSLGGNQDYGDIFGDPTLFQSSMFGAVDPKYNIGPGDQIIVMLWGETQFRQVLKVDREGFVFIPEIWGRA